jgi:hypothetical protein
MTSASRQIYSGDKIKQDEKVGVYSTCRREQMYVLAFGVEPPESKGQLVKPRRSCEGNLDLKEMVKSLLGSAIRNL